MNGFGKVRRDRQARSLARFGKRQPGQLSRPFSKVTVNVQFTLNQAGMVAGLYFRPADTPLPPLEASCLQQARSCSTNAKSRSATGEWKLPGTLTLPTGKGPFPAVVLVHGPGPNDRDETMYSNHMFKDIAEGLGVSRGIAVLRYDKRTKVYGEKMSDGLLHACSRRPWTMR